MTHTPVRVTLDADDVVRAGIRSMLQPHARRVTILCGAERAQTQVMIYDPVRHRQTGTTFPPVPLVALMADTEPASSALAASQGAVRVLAVSVSATQLVRTVEEVFRTQQTSAAHREPDRRSPSETTGIVQLSMRESDVLRYICEGRSNADICEALFLSINSVKTYIRSLYRKIGVERRVQAVRWGMDHGFA